MKIENFEAANDELMLLATQSCPTAHCALLALLIRRSRPRCLYETVEVVLMIRLRSDHQGLGMKCHLRGLMSLRGSAIHLCFSDEPVQVAGVD